MDDLVTRMCARKKKLSKSDADKTIKEALKGGTYLRAYECPACHGWHLTKKGVRV